jgi:hypothetical protein
MPDNPTETSVYERDRIAIEDLSPEEEDVVLSALIQRDACSRPELATDFVALGAALTRFEEALRPTAGSTPPSRTGACPPPRTATT